MQTISLPRGSKPTIVAPVRGAVAHQSDPGGPGAREALFIELLDGYRHSGSLVRADDVMAVLRRHGAPDIATVARWIVRREVVHFEWQAETWLPMFQLAGADMRPHAAVARVIAELDSVMSPWAVAQWFARPNIELAGRRPADVLVAQTIAVVQAARADRWLVDA